MKKILALFSALSLALTLTACGEGHYPAAALDGAVWDKEWTILGTALGVEDMTAQGLTLEENPVVLTGDDTFYATWSYGEGRDYVNADGKDATVYDAQVYLLLYGCADAESAQTALSEFMERERETYTITEEAQWEENTQTYTVFSYKTASDTNPYHHGAVAFGVFQNYVVSAELTCSEDFDALYGQQHSAEALLRDFLHRSHYSGDYHFQTN